LTDPLGIDVEKPRFSWKQRPQEQVRGQHQTAYRLLVASSKELLHEGRADLWDSGGVASSQSVLVPYDGEPLLSGEAYYWKVRTWDKDNKPSAWSAPARFSMGLLNTADWQGSWIAHPDAAAESHIWFRKNLSLDSGVPLSSGFIHVASMGYHELYVNGDKVDDRVLAPSLTRLDKRVQYVTYDIADMLTAGENTVAVWYGPGWSRYRFFKEACQQILKVQFNGRLSDGRKLEFASDSSWRCQVSSSQNIGPIKYSNNGGELIDARRHLPNWNQLGFDDSAWPLAREVEASVALSPQMSEPSRIIEMLPAREIKADPEVKSYRVDMGKNFTGWIELKLHGQSAGDRITIKVSNQPDTEVDFHQVSHYICVGAASETYRNRFNYIAGRWITIEGLKHKPELIDITGHAISTDMERVGHFTSSNELFNKIYETDLWTYLANTTEGFTADCPHRERMGYGEVGFATAWGIGLPNYRSGAFCSKIVRDWTDMQRDDGWLHHTVPQINQHYGGPLWSSSGLNIAWEAYQTYGDTRILESAYSTSRRWLEFLQSHVEAGLLRPYAGHWGRFLGEWANPDHQRNAQPREFLYFNNCIYALNLTAFINIAEILGNEADIAEYRSRFEALKLRIHQEFFDPERNIYVAGRREGRQVDLALALMLELPPEHLRPAILANFEKEITETRAYLDMGSSGLPILLKFITEEYQREEIVATHLNKTTQPSYGYFLKRGETTWPEYWSVDVPSRIHTCYTGIASYFMKSLAGIRPDPEHPGFQSFLIEPTIINSLDFAEGETQSVYGRISSRWELSDSGLELTVTIPPNSQAMVSMPTLGTPASAFLIREGEATIWENSQPASSLPDGITFSHRRGEGDADSRIVWRVESGSYRFGLTLIGSAQRL
jgi:alpha-L-rhamnosidase